MLCDSIDNFISHISKFMPAIKELTPLLEAVKTKGFGELRTMDWGSYKLCFNEYDTKPEPEVAFETHVKYWDLQIVIDGAEYLGWAPAARLSPAKPYDEKDDIAFYTGVGQKILLDFGTAVLLAPWDGHQPGISITRAASHVRKVVVKIPAEKF